MEILSAAICSQLDLGSNLDSEFLIQEYLGTSTLRGQLKASVEPLVKCAFVKIEKNAFKVFKLTSYLA